MKGAIIAATLLLVALGAGCVQMPTEKREVVDLRPQLTFRIASRAFDPAQLRVYVDNLDMGFVSSYLEGQATLRVLPGSHLVRVEDAGRTVFNERVYVADGVTRTLLIN
jgi:hypothetical protein